MNRFQTGQGPRRANSNTNGSRPITFVWLWPATDHEPHCRHVPITKSEGGLNLLHEADDDAVIRLESTATACDTREINRHAILIRGVKNWWKNCHLVGLHCEGLPMKKITGIHHFITILWYVFICVQLLFAHNISFSYKSECPGRNLISTIALFLLCWPGWHDLHELHSHQSGGARGTLGRWTGLPGGRGIRKPDLLPSVDGQQGEISSFIAFLPARRYASANTSDDPMSNCLCLCLSVHLSVSVTSHIVDSCPLSRFEGGLQQLHTADDSAVHWLETAAKKALAKWNEQVSVLPKRMNESGWFWLDSYLRPILHCVIRKFTHLQKWGYFHLDICSKLWI